MSNVDRHAPGSFCWIELGTTDQDAAKNFYNSLFGWTAADSPMGPDAMYTTFSLNGRRVGGGYNVKMMPGVPPHWMIYVATTSADETAAKVKNAGGKTMCDPMDVGESGRFVVFQDPTGAHVSAWQPKKHQGYEVEGENGSLCWADLMTPDPQKAADFYKKIFGWSLDPGQDGSGYLHIKNGEHFIGGIPPKGALPPGVPPHWALYIQVENCDASTAKAKSLGAQIFMPPTTMEKVGRWSVIADLQGAAFALFQPERR